MSKPPSSSSPSSPSALSWRLRLYWRLRALPTGRIQHMVETIARGREGGAFGKALAAIHLAVEVAEWGLMPQEFFETLASQGYEAPPKEVMLWLTSELLKSPDLRESGREHDGSLHLLHSEAMGVVRTGTPRPGMMGADHLVVHPGRFLWWAERHLWTTGLLDATASTPTHAYEADPLCVTPTPPPTRPAPTSNPGPAELAQHMDGDPNGVQTMLLIGPSGSGKSITAAAVAAELGRADRTLRLSGAGFARKPTLALSLIQLLRPSCVVFDDLPLRDTVPVMALLEQLHQLAVPVLVILTAMHEGPPETVRLPGLRPERLDLVRFFHAPTSADQQAVLVFHGLDELSAHQISVDPRVRGWTGAYLARLARGMLRGESYEGLIGTLTLHRQIAAHDAPQLLSQSMAGGWGEPANPLADLEPDHDDVIALKVGR